jgi:hypothetical protein
MQPLSGAAQFGLAHVLDPDEAIDQVAPAVGSALVLTNRRLLVVREGARFRPKTGIRSFAFDLDLRIRLGPGRKRVIIATSVETINVFVRVEQVAAAELLLAEVRRRIYRHDGGVL